MKELINKYNQLIELFPTYQSNPEVEQTKDMLIELTMSCSHEEAIQQAELFAKKFDKSADITKFIAACNLYLYLVDSMKGKY